jgi:hypothetical protein
MIVTLASTGMVPATVDPEVGDVMVTTRLPNWAEASGVEIQARLRTVATAAALASLRQDDSVLVFMAFSQERDGIRTDAG